MQMSEFFKKLKLPYYSIHFTLHVCKFLRRSASEMAEIFRGGGGGHN